MRAHSILLFLLLMSFTLLYGCSDRINVERLSHVIVLGLDLGEDNQIEVSFQIANPQVGSSQIDTQVDEPPDEVVTVTATDIISAKSLANHIVPKMLSFTNLEVIIVSEEMARSPLLHHMLFVAISDRELRRDTIIIVTKERASEFIKNNKPPMETRIHKYYSFMQQLWNQTGYYPPPTINRFLQRLTGELFLTVYATSEQEEQLYKDMDLYIAGEIPKKGGNPVQIIGSAVFKSGIMIDKLNDEESLLSIILRERDFSYSMLMSLPDPLSEQNWMTIRIMQRYKAIVTMDFDHHPVKIHVFVPLNVHIVSVRSLVDYTSNLENQTKLKKFIEARYEMKSCNFIEKTQKEYQSEPFLWHLNARQHFWTWKDYEQYDWEKNFSEAEVEVDFEVTFESFGKQLRPPNFNK